MKEIERKFLVSDAILEVIRYIEPKAIKQGYISDKDGITVRVRTKGDKGFLTIKGETTGITRDEFEYEIPKNDAESLLANFCPKILSKKRYELTVSERKWEIDVFEGKLAGLILAEIELESEEQEIQLPGWILEEVSTDPAYYNSNLIKR